MNRPDTNTETDYRAKHTLCDAMLWDYLQGKLDPAEALLVATHYHVSSEARKRITELNACAAVGLETLEPVAMKCSAEEFFKKCCGGSARKEDIAIDPSAAVPVPKPLQSYIGKCFNDVTWQTIVPGIQEKRIKLCGTKFAVRVLKIDKDTAIPNHTHTGKEASVVLHGSFADNGEVYKTGEVNYQPEGAAQVHGPKTLEDCICLVISTGHSRLPGILGAFVNPILRLRGL